MGSLITHGLVSLITAVALVVISGAWTRAGAERGAVVPFKDFTRQLDALVRARTLLADAVAGQVKAEEARRCIAAIDAALGTPGEPGADNGSPDNDRIQLSR